jgi:D-tagatose-1,6-bisphosphate aldolase subunit GatZ/KbaZ
LLGRLDGVTIPETLISQYLATLYPAVRAGAIPATPAALLEYAVSRVFDVYHQAVIDPKNAPALNSGGEVAA